MRLLHTRHVMGGRRLVVSFCDQAVSSASNFFVGLAVARLAGPAEFGAYMLALTLWLVVVGCHRSVVTEPITVATGGADAPEVVAHGVSADLLLGVAASALALVGGLAALSAGWRVATPVLAMAPWFASLLVQDYWRAMAFKQRRPGLALLNDSVFAAVQLAAVGVFWVLGWRSVGSMITAWGTGATAGAFLGLLWFPVSLRPRHGRSLLRRLWPLGRWLLAEFVASFTSDQAYLILVAALLSGVAYGGFRAALNLMGPVTVILMASGNIGLAEAARRSRSEDGHALAHFARRLSLLATLGVGLYGVVVVVAGGRMLRLLYGAEFARYQWLATLVAVQFGIYAVVFGHGLALKAAGRMRRYWRVQVLTAIASLISVFVLVRWLGTDGAGWGGVATAVYYSAGIRWLYHQEVTQPDRAARRPGGVTGGPVAAGNGTGRGPGAAPAAVVPSAETHGSL